MIGRDMGGKFEKLSEVHHIWYLQALCTLNRISLQVTLVLRLSSRCMYKGVVPDMTFSCDLCPQF